jgi:hypothetical protein
MCTHLSSGRLALNIFKHHLPSTSCSRSVYTQSISAANVLSPGSNQVVLPFYPRVRHLTNHHRKFCLSFRTGVVVARAEVQEASVTRKMEVASLQPAVSKRIQATDDPCIVQVCCKRQPLALIGIAIEPCLVCLLLVSPAPLDINCLHMDLSGQNAVPALLFYLANLTAVGA